MVYIYIYMIYRRVYICCIRLIFTVVLANQIRRYTAFMDNGSNGSGYITNTYKVHRWLLFCNGGTCDKLSGCCHPSCSLAPFLTCIRNPGCRRSILCNGMARVERIINWYSDIANVGKEEVRIKTRKLLLYL
jgi:hypothetical protein